MRALITILLLFHALFFLAQTPVQSNYFNSYSQRSVVGVSGGFNATSADFSNRLVKNIFLDETVDRYIVDSELSALKAAKNRMGIDYEVAVFAGWNFRQSAHSILLSASDGAHAHAELPANALDLAFSGNKKFAGDTLDFSSVQVQGLRFQQIGLGWAYQSGFGISLYGMLSYVNGEQYFNAALDRAKLYTSVLGDTVHLNLKGRYEQSDTGKTGFAAGNGSGVGLNFGLQVPFQALGQTNWNINFAVYNLGFIQWKPKSIQFAADTVVTWTGVEIPDIDNVAEQFLNNRVADSLTQGIKASFSKGSFRQWMPGSAVLELMQSKDKGTEMGAGMVMRWKANFKPYGYVKAGYRFSEHIAVHSQLGYGGYGKMQLGLMALLHLEHFQVELDFRNLEALIAPGAFAGGSGRLTLNFLI